MHHEAHQHMEKMKRMYKESFESQIRDSCKVIFDKETNSYTGHLYSFAVWEREVK